MGKIILNGILLLFVTVSLLAQTSDWKHYSNTAGNFHVLFPGDPTDSVNETNGFKGLDSHTLMFVQAPYVYTAIYSHLDEAQTVDHANFETFKTTFLKGIPNCKVETEQAAAPALDGYIGQWYRLNCAGQADIVAVGNLYWGKHYGYGVFVMYTKTAAAPPAQSKFLDSFGVIDPAK